MHCGCHAQRFFNALWAYNMPQRIRHTTVTQQIPFAMRWTGDATIQRMGGSPMPCSARSECVHCAETANSAHESRGACAIVRDCVRTSACGRACDVRECACVVECMLAHAYAATPAVPQADVGVQHKGGWFWYWVLAVLTAGKDGDAPDDEQQRADAHVVLLFEAAPRSRGATLHVGRRTLQVGCCVDPPHCGLCAAKARCGWLADSATVRRAAVSE